MYHYKLLRKSYYLAIVKALFGLIKKRKENASASDPDKIDQIFFRKITVP